jgi:hypothetical protein
MGKCRGPDCWYDCLACQDETDSNQKPLVVKSPTMKIGNLEFTEETEEANRHLAVRHEDDPRVQIRLAEEHNGWVASILLTGPLCLDADLAVQSVLGAVTSSAFQGSLYDIEQAFRTSRHVSMTVLGFTYRQEVERQWYMHGTSESMPSILCETTAGWRANHPEAEPFPTPEEACLASAQDNLKGSEDYMVGLRAEVQALLAQAGVK